MCLDHLSSEVLQSRSLLLTRNLNLSLSILKRRRATPQKDRTSVLEMEVILRYLLNSVLLTNVVCSIDADPVPVKIIAPSRSIIISGVSSTSLIKMCTLKTSVSLRVQNRKAYFQNLHSHEYERGS